MHATPTCTSADASPMAPVVQAQGGSRAAEVDRLSRAFATELGAEGEIARVLVRRMALMAVRMEESATEEMAATAARVRKARDEAEIPEGTDAAMAERLREEAGHIALFDPSAAAKLARKNEAADERSFFRALRELRQIRKGPSATGMEPSPAREAAQARAALARMSAALETPAKSSARKPAPRPAMPKAPVAPATRPTPPPVPTASLVPTSSRPLWEPSNPDAFEIPMTIGRRR